ncbi:MAG TPA: D-aminoacyl-tRNA deacylase, partial [Clostridia bacterium]|nr:D-aminoacyl-tRNA deacylase [Clostridia bacterium]
MIALIQRVKKSSVETMGSITGSISNGLNILLGVGNDDSPDDAKYLASKIAALRIFSDDNGRMNLSIQDVGGSALVISQFTLYADCR